MKILIIGGTSFLGRHLATAALALCHEVTLFHRGQHSWHGLAPVEEIFGDRNEDLQKLAHREWDAVIDTCGYLPQTVKASAAALEKAVGKYVFISSVSVYADFSHPNYTETSPLATLSSEQESEARRIDPKAEITPAALGDLYGALKARCEQEVQLIYADNTLVVRPGLIVGPFDPSDRFTYWAHRVMQSGPVLAPGSPNRLVQFIDARDLARWIMEMVARKATGTYNATSKPFELTFGQLLETMKAATSSDATFQWVSEAFLQQQGVKAWSEMPLYLPESASETSGFLSANIDRALAQKLTFRPLLETIQATIAWRATQPGPMKAGISLERERKLLAEYALQKG